MKRNILTIIILGVLLNIYSQNSGYYTDALRNYQNFYISTARSASLAGAYSSLGGDIGSIAINPAALGVYRSSSLVFTPGITYTNSSADFYNTKYKEANTYFNFPNIGLTLYLKPASSSEWQGTSIGFGYNQLNNFDNRYIIKGNTQNTSLINEFLNYADGVSYNQLDSYYERMAFDLALIDTLNGTNNKYFSPFNGIPIAHRTTIETSGHIGEFYMGFGSNYNNQLYFGLTFNIRSGFYKDNYLHKETDVNNKITDDNFTFSNSLDTWIKGFNVKFGLIYRPIENLRFGLTFHTPTVTKVEQEYITGMTVTDDNNTFYKEYPRDNNGNMLGKATDNYKITSPMRIILGTSYMFGQNGLISVDYEYADYSRLKLTNGDYPDAIDKANEQIQNIFKSTHNVRIGGEYKISSFYLRGGWAYYASPYAKNEINKNSYNMIFATGLGYRGKNISVDFGINKLIKKEKYFTYDHQNLLPADLDNQTNNFLLSIGFYF